MAVKLLISDFDGTLVDTFEANYLAYRQAFSECGINLTKECYRKCFGFRFDRFMNAVGIVDIGLRETICRKKCDCYPEYFEHLRVNEPLLDFLRAFRRSGGLTAIASTAREQNLRNALRHIGAENHFNLILAGENVSKGKPDPEIYLTVLESLGVSPREAVVFEDSDVGFRAAEAAGIEYIKVYSLYFDNGN